MKSSRANLLLLRNSWHGVRNDIDRFVKDPSLLMDLCREVIEQIDSSSEDAGVSDMEAQLREISRTIDRLEKARVAIPDVLRVAEYNRGLYCGKIIGEYLEKLVDLNHPPDRAQRMITYIMGAFTPVKLTSAAAPVRPSDSDDVVFLGGSLVKMT